MNDYEDFEERIRQIRKVEPETVRNAARTRLVTILEDDSIDTDEHLRAIEQVFGNVGVNG